MDLHCYCDSLSALSFCLHMRIRESKKDSEWEGESKRNKEGEREREPARRASRVVSYLYLLIRFDVARFEFCDKATSSLCLTSA